MRDRIVNTKNSVKSHIQTHRAKYAFVTGITVGHVATKEWTAWKGFEEISENVENVAKIATEV